MKIHEQSSCSSSWLYICPLKFFESICVEIFHDLFLKFCAFKNFEKKKIGIMEYFKMQTDLFRNF